MENDNLLDELYRGIAEEIKSKGDYTYKLTNEADVLPYSGKIGTKCMEVHWQDGSVLLMIDLEQALIYVREKKPNRRKERVYNATVVAKIELHDNEFLNKIHNILLLNNINNTTTNKVRVGGGRMC